jgi:bacterioferritin
MRGNPNVINELNAALKAELGAVLQYMVQAEMCENWGFPRLSSLTKRRAFEEMRHAEALVERILFLDGTPEVRVALAPTVGATVTEQFEAGLGDETGAIRDYNQAVRICREADDTGTRELFERMIVDEERHADFLEAQLHAIKEMGIGNYLTQHVVAEKLVTA